MWLKVRVAHSTNRIRMKLDFEDFEWIELMGLADNEQFSKTDT